jgi:hypothetical protein
MSRAHVSLLLRLLRAPATSGDIVGQAEIVDTGESVVIRNMSDLQELAARVAANDTRVCDPRQDGPERTNVKAPR